MSNDFGGSSSFDPRQYLKGDYLKADEITQPVVVTVDSATVKRFQSGDEKPVLSFLELDQSLVLNKTRVAACVTMLGLDPAKWVGQRITLAPGTQMGQRTIQILPAAAPAAPTVQWQGQQPQPAAPAGVQVDANGDIVFSRS